MKLEYLPLIFELIGLTCFVLAIFLLFGAVISLILASIVSLALGIVLERRRDREK